MLGGQLEVSGFCVKEILEKEVIIDGTVYPCYVDRVNILSPRCIKIFAKEGCLQELFRRLDLFETPISVEREKELQFDFEFEKDHVNFTGDIRQAFDEFLSLFNVITPQTCSQVIKKLESSLDKTSSKMTSFDESQVDPVEQQPSKRRSISVP
jgi:hypothetical protein